MPGISSRRATASAKAAIIYTAALSTLLIHDLKRAQTTGVGEPPTTILLHCSSLDSPTTITA
jgi:hypothetical protein